MIMVKGTGNTYAGHRDELKTIAKQMQELKTAVGKIKGADNSDKFDAIFEALKKADEKLSKRGRLLVNLHDRLQRMETACAKNIMVINGMSEEMQRRAKLFNQLGKQTGEEQADEVQETEKEEQASRGPAEDSKEVAEEIPTKAEENATSKLPDSPADSKKEEHIEPAIQTKAAEEKPTATKAIEIEQGKAQDIKSTSKKQAIEKRRAKKAKRRKAAAKRRNR